MSPVEPTHYFINILNFVIMQKFIISLKEKQSGRDVVPPYIIDSLDGLGTYSERISPLGLVIIVDSIKEESNFVDFKTQTETQTDEPDEE